MDSSTTYLELPDGVIAYDSTGDGPLIVATPAIPIYARSCGF
jgi:hypothetical protein